MIFEFLTYLHIFESDLEFVVNLVPQRFLKGISEVGQRHLFERPNRK